MLSHRARSSFASLPANRAARSSSGARATAAPAVGPLAILEARTSPGGGVTKGRESGSFTTCCSRTGRFGSAVADRSGLRLGSLRRCSVIGDSFFVHLLEIFSNTSRTDDPPADANRALQRVRAAVSVLLALIRRTARGSEPCLFASLPCWPAFANGESRCRAPRGTLRRPCCGRLKFQWRDSRNRSADNREPPSRTRAVDPLPRRRPQDRPQTWPESRATIAGTGHDQPRQAAAGGIG